ncbi:Gre1p PWA37_000463 [Arxiozyma heterogenica]|uniref:Uncharacterized protein n=1 Tax=Arxiozyma heterogenica TaxID=278026 RepID=A0AAN7ZX57_9SACH|nr:hypothetical protein RI543_003950 [Kazachstania heterogenica]
MSNLFNKFAEKLHGDNDDDQSRMSHQRREQQQQKNNSMQSESWRGGNQSGQGYNDYNDDDDNDDNFNTETFGTAASTTTGQGYNSGNLSQQQSGGYTRNAMGQNMGGDRDDDDFNDSGLNDEEEQIEADKNQSFGRNMSSGDRRSRRNQSDGNRSQGYQEMYGDQPW